MKKIVVLVILIFLMSFSLFSQTPEKIAKEASSYRNQGQILQAKGDLKGALLYYREALGLDSLSYEILNDLGVVYEGLGDEDSAIRMYIKAIEISRNYLPPYANLALLYEKRNDEINAIYYWQQRYLLDPNESEWKRKAIKRIIDINISDEVKREIMKGNIISIEELKKLEEAQLHFDMGKQMAAQGDHSKAAIEFKKTLGMLPLDREMQMEVSQYYVKTKEMRDKGVIKAYLKEASNCIDIGDYNLAASKLKEALSVIFSVLD